MIAELRDRIPLPKLAKLFDISKATMYRKLHISALAAPAPGETPAIKKPRTSYNAIPAEIKAKVIEIVNLDENADKSFRQIWMDLLDLGVYYCHWRTMYRWLKKIGMTQERRNQCRIPKSPKPHLRATGPKQVLAYDITRIPGPSRGTWYFLYAVFDLYSRCLVGWTIRERESGYYVRRLLVEIFRKPDFVGIDRKLVTLHSDRGAPMKSRPVMDLLEELGVGASFSRPRVSNDNPHVESAFKTFKYRHEFPKQFENIEKARHYLTNLLNWYNNEHHHSGLAFFTPMQVFTGEWKSIAKKRNEVMQKAYAENPERFSAGVPKIKIPAAVVEINPLTKGTLKVAS